MRTLTVSVEKGGTGKSLLAFHAAHHFTAAGLRTLLIDLDAQQAAVSEPMAAHASTLSALHLFASRDGIAIPPSSALMLAGRTRELEGVERLDAVEMVENFQASLRLCAPHYDVCVIDTPPASGARTSAALLAADLIVAPIELHETSLAGVEGMLTYVEGVYGGFGKAVPDWTRHRPLLVSRFNTRMEAQKRWFADLAGAVGRIVIEGKVVTRDAYARTYAEALPVWALRDHAGKVSGGIKAASDEMRGVMREIGRMMQVAA